MQGYKHALLAAGLLLALLVPADRLWAQPAPDDAPPVETSAEDASSADGAPAVEPSSGDGQAESQVDAPSAEPLPAGADTSSAAPVETSSPASSESPSAEASDPLPATPSAGSSDVPTPPVSSSDEPPAAPSDAPPAAPAAEAVTVDLTPAHQPWAHYRVLAERNIFVRGAARRAGGQEGGGDKPATPAPTSPPPPVTWVLTGIVIHPDGRVAFFENTSSHLTLRVEEGQEVGSVGKVVRITAGRVEVQLKDENRQVEIGQSIDGVALSLSADGSSSIFGDAPASTGEASGAASGGASGGTSGGEASGGNQDLLERMRANRRRERGQ